jgi:hypothetical protein
MAAWRMDGKPRTARRFTVYKNCPLPTPEDRLLLILTYVKTYALHVVQGRLFGMVQSKANRWMHVLLPALLAALRALGDAPARSLTALAQRLGVAADARGPRSPPGWRNGCLRGPGCGSGASGDIERPGVGPRSSHSPPRWAVCQGEGRPSPTHRRALQRSREARCPWLKTQERGTMAAVVHLPE